mmetsp:Transcript_2439/g.6238  ORF Transcript_2439/g.6238 Transcript_2439/m.6238 type:complete len:204 (-) Transcript_2439:626-1237(-)
MLSCVLGHQGDELVVGRLLAHGVGQAGLEVVLRELARGVVGGQQRALHAAAGAQVLVEVRAVPPAHAQVQREHAEGEDVHPHDEHDGHVHGGAHVRQRLHGVPGGATLIQDARARKVPDGLHPRAVHARDARPQGFGGGDLRHHGQRGAGGGQEHEVVAHVVQHVHVCALAQHERVEAKGGGCEEVLGVGWEVQVDAGHIHHA